MGQLDPSGEVGIGHLQLKLGLEELKVTGIMGKKMGTTIGNYYSTLGLYRDNGEENGNYHSILGLYGDNGEENGNYHSTLE